MQTKTLLIALIAFAIGAVGGHLITKKDTASETHTMSMESMMASMNAELQGKQGDEFDRAFLTEMTAHHQGAVQMATMALQSAKHTEIKNMAQEIITAQNAEIKQMQDWQSAWYGHSEGAGHHTTTSPSS